MSFLGVSVGQGHVCAINTDSWLYCWGRNVRHELGLGDDTAQTREPRRVGTLRDWQRVAAGQTHTCGIRGGDLFCWGGDTHGELGFGLNKEEPVRTPVQVGGGPGWTEVDVSWFHTCGIREGAVHCWGRGIEGQLGLGDFQANGRPSMVGAEQDWEDIAVARFHTCGRRDNDVWCWGENTEQQPLGVPAVEGRQASPRRVSAP